MNDQGSRVSIKRLQLQKLTKKIDVDVVAQACNPAIATRNFNT